MADINTWTMAGRIASDPETRGRCGHHFAPDLAVARLTRHLMYRDAQLAQEVL